MISGLGSDVILDLNFSVFWIARGDPRSFTPTFKLNSDTRRSKKHVVESPLKRHWNLSLVSLRGTLRIALVSQCSPARFLGDHISSTFCVKSRSLLSSDQEFVKCAKSQILGYTNTIAQLNQSLWLWNFTTSE